MNKSSQKILVVLVVALIVFCLLENRQSTVSVGADADVAQVRTTTCATCDGKGVCKHCNGDGFRDGLRCRTCKGEGVCQTCLGEGQREVLVIDGKDYVYCSICHGTGKCRLCNGSGQGEYWQQHCSICGGNGRCALCNGKGVTRLRGF